MNLRSLSILGLLLPLVAACERPSASAQWIHPELAPELASRDLSLCRKEADLEVARKVGYDDVNERTPSGSPIRQGDPIRVRSLVERAIADCMLGKGYRRAGPTAK
ncbi:MAG: hypothetical protein HZC25_00260 [Rhodospirillales bacterium]|nr:hypothetical protein [Rhodospirillales bacterium]